MSEAHRSAVRDYLAAYNAADWSKLQRLVGPGYVHHSGEARLTLEQFLAGAAAMKRAFPDMRIVVQDLLADEDKVVARYVGGGTHEGSLTGEDPTGRQIVVHGITIFRFAHGLIVEDWEALDELGLLQAVGALPSPA